MTRWYGLRSLRARLALGASAGVAAVVVVAGVTLLAVATRDQYDILDEALTRATRRTAIPAARAAAGQDAPLLASALSVGDVVVRVEDGTTTRYDSRGPGASPWPDVAPGFSTVAVDGQGWRVYRTALDEVASTRAVRGSATFELEVALPVAATEDAVATLTRRTVAVGAAAVVAAGAVGWLAGAVAVRPLRRLQGTAERVAATRDLSLRAEPANAPPEVAAVVERLNVMLERLEETAARERAALDTSRTFAANVTHELRTPLTSLRTNLDVLRHPTLPLDERAQVLDEAQRAAARMTGLLGALEVLARGNLFDEARHERVDLPALVDGVVEEVRRRHPDMVLTVKAGTAAPEVRGWPEGLRVLVGNLLENAAVHGTCGATPPSVEVAVLGGYRRGRDRRRRRRSRDPCRRPRAALGAVRARHCGRIARVGARSRDRRPAGPAPRWDPDDRRQRPRWYSHHGHAADRERTSRRHDPLT